MSNEIEQEIIDEYLAECSEILERVSAGLALLERSEHDSETLNSMYRDMHTFKGSSMLFGFINAGEIAHVMEASLDPVRKMTTETKLSLDFINIQYRCVDLLEEYLGGIRNKDFSGDKLNERKIELVTLVVDVAAREFGKEYISAEPIFMEDIQAEQSFLRGKSHLEEVALPESSEEIVGPAGHTEPVMNQAVEESKVEEIVEGELVSRPSQSEQDAKSAIASALSEVITETKLAAAEKNEERAAQTAASAALADLSGGTGIDKIKQEVARVVEAELAGNKKESFAERKGARAGQSSEKNLLAPVVDIGVGKESSQHLEAQKKAEGLMSNIGDKEHSNKVVSKDVTIRVSVDLLDKLMNLVGELVLVRNQVSQYSMQYDDMEFSTLSQNLDIVTSDIQAEIMKTRMQPIGNVLNKYVRIVRDIASDLDKNIRLELTGIETELDKTLLEAIRDPLTHIIRNCCDHGIETPDERVASGKSEEGHIYIRSFHEGGQVVVQIKDDGRGINKNRVVGKALEKGLITEERLDGMSEKDIFALLMMPGFSTAEKVSSVSGRGVGMDVVKTNIEAIGGAIEISSVEGEGTELNMKIPLTLAIVPAMLVSMGKVIFAIPQVLLAELVRVEPSDNGVGNIELLQGKPIYRLRGDLLPLVSLEEVLSGKEMNKEEIGKLISETVNIVVLNSDGVYFGLIVEEILDTADIVVKPISQFLKSLKVFSGATILGDGTVSLILDVVGISEKAELGSRVTGTQSTENEEKIATMSQEFLTFSMAQNNTYAIPLCLVNRLEKFSKDDIEFSGEQRIVQYRNSILPIVSLSDELKFTTEEDGIERPHKDVNVIVVQKSGMFFGLEVEDIEDVVVIDDTINEDISDRLGVMGNVIYNDKVIVIVDVLMILAGIIERSGKTKGVATIGLDDSKPKNIRSGKTILLAEDTPFFRRKIKSVLENAGFDVLAAENGQEALDQLKAAKDGSISILLSDIEMPVLDGFELATKIREEARFSSLPLIAITTRFRDRDIERGKDVGFNAYLEKLNEEELIKHIDSFLPKGA